MSQSSENGQRDGTTQPRFNLRGVPIVDTFAEAFPMTGTRLIVTAATPHWAQTAANVFCGYATSVIGCDLEAGVEQVLPAEITPDGRPGVALLAFAFNRDRLEKGVVNRTGQCVLTSPTSACFDGFPAGDPEKRVKLGDQLRFFGDGFQQSKVIGRQRYWRIPTMDGEFVCEDRIGTFKGVAGGNLIVSGRSLIETLSATEAAVAAMRRCPGVILPFPGGVVRSGSKVGSKYSSLRASTNDAYCPSLRSFAPKCDLPAEAQCAYEIVIDGITLEHVQAAMARGVISAVEQPGVVEVTAGNYGGKLGPHHIFLRDLPFESLDGPPKLL